jgi:hypothetical protein
MGGSPETQIAQMGVVARAAGSKSVTMVYSHLID